jgi:hypothetical protein
VPLLSAAYADPVAVDDGQGGAIVICFVNPYPFSSGVDLRANRVQHDGELAPGWEPGGTIVCRGTAAIDGPPTGPAVVSDGAGGALVVWEDGRNSPYAHDIYAQRVTALGNVVAVKATAGPAVFRVLPVRPNPARGTIQIAFDLPSEGTVTVEVLDVSGRVVRRLAVGDQFGAGRNTIRWDGRAASGARAPDGIYFVRVETQGAVGTRRLVLLH